jgi:proline- and glutamine-rich splicing factor
VKNLGPKVSNELLHRAFSLFGSVERALVLAEGERPRSKGEGIVEFSNKRAAQEALVACQEGHFVLTKTLVPVVVEPYEVMRTRREGVEVFFYSIMLFRRI